MVLLVAVLHLELGRGGIRVVGVPYFTSSSVGVASGWSVGPAGPAANYTAGARFMGPGSGQLLYTPRVGSESPRSECDQVEVGSLCPMAEALVSHSLSDQRMLVFRDRVVCGMCVLY